MTAAAPSAPATPAARIKRALEQHREQFAASLPIGIERGAFLQALQAILIRDAKGALAKCSPASVLSCAAECASMGLVPNDARKLAHIIPYGGQATVMLGFAGLRTLALRSPEVRSIGSQAVYDGDDFALDFASDDRPHHRLNPRAPRGEMIGVYAYALMRDGTCITEWAGMDDIGKFRAAAGGASKAWAGWESEMARKSVLKRLCKSLPLTLEAARGIELDNQHADPDAVTPERHAASKRTTLDDILGGASVTRDGLDEDAYIDIEAEEAGAPEGVA